MASDAISPAKRPRVAVNPVNPSPKLGDTARHHGCLRWERLALKPYSNLARSDNSWSTPWGAWAR
jgi:hypothetical protein